MQLDFHFWVREETPVRPVVELESGPLPLVFERNDRAKRYLLYLRADGTARVTIPRRGSERQARIFVEEHKGWLERAVQARAAKIITPKVWSDGTEFLYRGEGVVLRTAGDGTRVSFADMEIPLRTAEVNLRPLVEGAMFAQARRELPERVFALARVHGCSVARVTVRNQSSRWGSCSARGTISLNWRLIQVPPGARDYVILHELMHTREMNHSSRFWRLVQQVCPDHQEWETWLKVHGPRLGL